MRLSTVFISSTFVLAGTSAAFPVEAEDMLVARFADPDFLSEVEARAYDEEPELYVHGGAISTNNYKTLSRHRRSFHESPRYEFTRRNLPGSWPVENSEPRQKRVTFASDTDGPPRRSSSPTPPESPRNGFRASVSNMFRTTGSSLSNKFRNRRSFDELPQSELTRRHEWEPVPDSPRVHWTSDTVDPPTRPRRPLTPVPSRPDSPSSPNGNGWHYHRRSFSEPPSSELTRRHEWEPVPDSPRVHWTSDTVDPPTRPRRPLTPVPSRPQSPSSPNGNGWHSQHSYHRRYFSEPPSSKRIRLDPPVPDSPPRGVHWSPDTVDTPDRPRIPPTPVPSRPHSPSSPNGNGWHPQRHHPRSFFDLD